MCVFKKFRLKDLTTIQIVVMNPVLFASQRMFGVQYFFHKKIPSVGTLNQTFTVSSFFCLFKLQFYYSIMDLVHCYKLDSEMNLHSYDARRKLRSDKDRSKQ